MISQQTRSETITLTVTNHVGSTHECQLAANEGVFIGTSSNCRLQLTGDGLSDIHCRIEHVNGKVSVQDWMSASGTQVNGQTITTKADVATSDVIQIGQHQIRLATGRPDPVDNRPRTDSTEIPRESASADESSERPALDYPSENVDNVIGQGSDHTEPLQERQTRDEQQDPHADSQDLEPLAATSMDEPVSVDGPNFTDGPRVADELGSMDIEADFFEFEEEETYDRETVALLQAEIEDLQTALAQRDAEQFNHGNDRATDVPASAEEDSDAVLKRMQELIDEANRSDERVAILEEMLFAAEVTSRSEQDERGQLEAWVGDIEKRIGQREDEHKAEIEALQRRLAASSQEQEQLKKHLRQAAGSGRAPERFEEVLENLQSRNLELQERFEDSEKERLSLQRRLEQQAEEQERALRDERVTLAQEKAKVSRMRFELSNKLSDIEEMPKASNNVDTETAHKIRTLREHLREIHEQEKQEAKEASLATRLTKLWKRVEY